MRVPTSLILFTLAWSWFAAPALAQGPKSVECQLDGTQLDMNQCANQRWMTADAEMNRLYTEQMAHLDAIHKKRLYASQHAWLGYRDLVCQYEAGRREESGSIWPATDALCRESLTKQRSQILQKYVECRSDGCP
ncbi:MAG: lysozyme inhibitor LprI family protein [Pseudomonadota bacterium]|nr:lysozyme inhibitor LprI family protein [Pseudomonadota bacterium]